MEIIDFLQAHVPQAQALAGENYRSQRAFTALPENPVFPVLSGIAENPLGVAAVEDGKLVGYLYPCLPFPNAFGSAASGVYLPLTAHAAIAQNRGEIYQRMYQYAAEKWTRAGAAYHAMTFYAYDRDAMGAMFQYGFGMRCVDAIRKLADNIPEPVYPGIMFSELSRAQLPEIRALERCLVEHLGKSPCFMRESEAQIEAGLDEEEGQDVRVFVAYAEKMPAAFLKVCAEGETFVSALPCVINICGAYCLESYRGSGLMRDLIGFVSRQMYADGYTYLGVDYESMNPTANRFWCKYFTPYTFSLTRRIDECGLMQR